MKREKAVHNCKNNDDQAGRCKTEVWRNEVKEPKVCAARLQFSSFLSHANKPTNSVFAPTSNVVWRVANDETNNDMYIYVAKFH